MYIKF